MVGEAKSRSTFKKLRKSPKCQVLAIGGGLWETVGHGIAYPKARFSEKP